MITVPYQFYSEVYNGQQLTQSEFEEMQTNITVMLDSMCTTDVLGLTDSKLDENTLLKYKMCICSMSDNIKNVFEDGVLKGTISQEKVGAWSTTYKVSEGTSAYSSLLAVVNMYLSGTELMCAWV